MTDVADAYSLLCLATGASVPLCSVCKPRLSQCTLQVEDVTLVQLERELDLQLHTSHMDLAV